MPRPGRVYLRGTVSHALTRATARGTHDGAANSELRRALDSLKRYLSRTSDLVAALPTCFLLDLSLSNGQRCAATGISCPPSMPRASPTRAQCRFVSLTQAF